MATPAELVFQQQQQQEQGGRMGWDWGKPLSEMQLLPGWSYQDVDEEGSNSGWLRDPKGNIYIPGAGIEGSVGAVQMPDGTWAQDYSALQKWAGEQRGFDIFDYGPYAAMAAVGGLGAGLFDSALGIGSSLPSSLGGAGGLSSASWGVNPIGGGGLYSAEGFLPGSFELGASGYGGTAAAGLDAAAAEWLAGAGGAGGGFADLASQQNYVPGSEGFELGQSGYGPNVSATQGLNLAAAEAGAGAAGGITAPPGASSALQRILSGNGTPADYASLLATGAGAGLDYLGNKERADATRDVANQYFGLGAPYRAMLPGMFAPGYDVKQLPGLQSAMETSADVLGRQWSAKVGNPAENPTAMMETQKYLTGSLALPQLNTTRSQLINAGGLGLDTSGRASMEAAGGQGALYDSLAAGVGLLSTPTGALEEQLRRLQQMGGGGQRTPINLGYSL